MDTILNLYSRFSISKLLFVPIVFFGMGVAISGVSSVTQIATTATNTNPTRIASERKSVNLTVYNSNLALIREERTINLGKGQNYVIVPEIPATIDPTSLHFSSLTNPAGVRVLEQNYQYDLVNHGKILEKYLGKQVEFVRVNAETKKEYSVFGNLLSSGGNSEEYGATHEGTHPGMVAEIGGKIELNPVGRLVLPSLPEGLILKPQLEWMLTSDQAGEHRSEISYLANAISWSCDYVALLNKDDDHLDLKGWVTLVNNSGTSFKDAGLKLVAGDVNQVQQNVYEARNEMKMAVASEPQFQQKELFEYKLYSLQRHTNLNNNESKQIELVSAKNAVAKKILIYDGIDAGWHFWVNNANYRNQGSFGQQGNPKVGVYMNFRNDEKSGLGMPLPKGKVRVYKRDDDGQEQFVGEDLLDHTPKNEEVRLYLGNAFDIVGSRTQSDFRSLSSGHVVEETFEIKVRNHKKEAIEVMVYEHPWRGSQWDMAKTTIPFEKMDQTTIRFSLKIPADKEKAIIYTLRYSW